MSDDPNGEGEASTPSKNQETVLAMVARAYDTTPVSYDTSRVASEFRLTLSPIRLEELEREKLAARARFAD